MLVPTPADIGYNTRPGRDVSEMPDCLTTIDDVAPRLGAELYAAADAPALAAQRDRIVGTLTRHLPRARPIDARLPRLAAFVAERREPLTVRSVARETGLGIRRVQQLFRDDVGLSPKQLHRITRFQRALALGRSHSCLTWSAIASRSGYYDQAHLIHESREIAGCTPAELLGGDRPHELTEAFLAREEKRR